MISSKKVVIILTEGVNDVDLLKPYLNKLVDKSKIRFEITNGDILTKSNNKNKNAKTIVGDAISDICKKRKFQDKDILFVAHILDLDGSYINDTDFSITSSLNKSKEYNLSKQKILVKSELKKQSLLNIWGKKKSRQEVLFNTTKIKKLDYYIFYNSINSEHVISGNILECQEDKEKCIEDFLDNVDLEGFKTLLSDENILLSREYITSWEKIVESNGFKRASNLYLLIERLLTI